MSEKKETRAELLKQVANSSLEGCYGYTMHSNTHVAAAACARAMRYDVDCDEGLLCRAFMSDETVEPPLVLTPLFSKIRGLLDNESSARTVLENAEYSVVEVQAALHEANKEPDGDEVKQKRQALTGQLNGALKAVAAAEKELRKVSGSTVWVHRVLRYATKLANSQLVDAG
jgi:hypothetical protein